MKNNFPLSKIVLIGVILVIFELVCAIGIIYFFQKNQIESRLSTKTNIIKSDLKFANGKWDITQYSKDPEILGRDTLYIFSLDGFVLDRRTVINGFLDSSDYKKLSSYSKIQTVVSPTGQKRRMLSKVVKKGNDDFGVVTVSYFDPKNESLQSIDDSLVSGLEGIFSQIKFKNGNIDVSSVDEKKVPYNVSFIIVDKYNVVLKKTSNVNNIGRVPNFIDPSYVKAQTLASEKRIVQDSVTKENYFVFTKPLLAKSGETIGVVIVGESLDELLNLIKNFAFIFGLISLLVMLGVSFGIYRLYSDLNVVGDKVLPSIKLIYFDDKHSELIIDQNAVQIAYATNQFYLLKTLFSNPSKRWESDELMDRFGELNAAMEGRKVYDAMININKKISGYLSNQKLIINQNKTYQLNPKLPVTKSYK